MARAFIRVMGGVGNQIFQYALAQWLAREAALSPVLYDPGSDARRGPQTRAVQLHELFGDCRIAHGGLARAVHWLSLSSKYQAAMGGLALRHYAFQDAHTWASVTEAARAAKHRPLPVFSGYFQFADLVRSELDQLRTNTAAELDRRTAQLLRRGALAGLQREQDCIVHVRRGDYRLIAGFPVLGTDYYAPAARLLADRGFRGRVYCVSDEPADAKAALAQAGIGATCLDLDDPLDVLAAIAHVRFKVIANSTLSLWGGLLGQAGGTVVFPSQWPPGAREMPQLCASIGWIEGR